MQNSTPALNLNTIGLLARLSKSTNHHLALSSQDISQVIALLDQSITELTQHFMAVDLDLKLLQQTLVTPEAKEILEHSKREMLNAVVDMQFHDIAHQLLTRAQGGMNALQHTMQAITADSALIQTSQQALEDSDFQAYEKCLEKLIEGINNTSHCPPMTIAPALGQAPMSGGDIDLF